MKQTSHNAVYHSAGDVLPIASLLAGALTVLNGRRLGPLVPHLHRQPALHSAPAQPKPLSIVIPCRNGSYPRVTLQSLARQTFRDFDVIVSFDHGRGANWARNRGFRLVRSGMVLFSDDDIEWNPDALLQLKSTLDAHPGASYSYGTYTIPGVGVRANVPFDPLRLRRVNYISTMSMIRTKDFPWFDESIRRFQDWDLWLTLLARGKTGVHCGTEIFRTRQRNGITHGNPLNPLEATRIIKAKHHLR